MTTAIAPKIDAFALRLAKKAGSRMPDECIAQIASAATSDKRGYAATTYTPQTGPPMLCRADGQLGREMEVQIDGVLTAVRTTRVSLVAYRKDAANAWVAVQLKERDRLRILARGTRQEQVLDIIEVAEREGVMIQVYGRIITN